MTATRFPIRVGRKSRLPLRVLFGVRADDTWIDLGDGPEAELEVQFGWAHFRTPMRNLASWRIEGPWLWITAIGVRRGIFAGDISFDGNHKAGVRLDFKDPERRSIVRIPRLYVTVADPEGLGAALSAAGIPGEDARKAQ